MDTIRLADIELTDPRKYGVRGYASATDVLVPDFGEIVDHGAFQSILQRIGRLPITYNHDFESVQIGFTTHLAEDSKGLYFEGSVVPTAEAATVLTAIAARDRMPASFTFLPGEAVVDPDTGILHIKSFSDIIELGPVIVGANPEAYIELMPVADATDATADVDQIVTALEQAARNIEGVIAI